MAAQEEKKDPNCEDLRCHTKVAFPVAAFGFVF